MFIESPSGICAVVETTTRKRKASGPVKSMGPLPSAPIANAEAIRSAQPKGRSPRVSNPIPAAAIKLQQPFDAVPLAGNLSMASEVSQSKDLAPWSSGHITLTPYVPAPETTAIIDEIVYRHRLRQGMIKAQIKLTLQAMATVRFATHEDGDYDTDEAKAKARKKADDLYRQIAADPTHDLFPNIAPYLLAQEPLNAQRDVYEKELVKLVRQLPVYAWAKGVKGLGDTGLATIVGECGDIGTYKSVSAVWKRMGLAPYNGKAGKTWKMEGGLSKEEWIDFGYVGPRRSVAWNMGNSLILGMGKFRPLFGEDVDANEAYTYYQKVFANRARYEAPRAPRSDGSTDIRVSDKGKESFSGWAVARAKRYTEKRLLKHLYLEWRRA